MRRTSLVARWLMLSLLGVLAGCDLVGVRTRIVGREPFAPLPEYAGWWHQTEACSGRTGDLGRIEWALATSIEAADGMVFGIWMPPHEIVLVRGREDDAFTVRHEMLHDLLGGDANHSSPPWTTCGLFADP